MAEKDEEEESSAFVFELPQAPCWFDVASMGPSSRSLIGECEEPGSIGSIHYAGIRFELTLQRGAEQPKLTVEIRSGGNAYSRIPGAAHPLETANLFRALNAFGGFDEAWRAAWAEQLPDFAASYDDLVRCAMSVVTMAENAAELARGLAAGDLRLEFLDRVIGRVPFASMTSIDPEYLPPLAAIYDRSGDLVGYAAEDRLTRLFKENT